MIIKVCGLREPDNIRAVSELGVDWIGFIFWPDSSRYVSQIRSRAGIIPDYSSLDRPGKQMETTALCPKRVGVFVDDMPQTIVTRVVNYNLDIVQLHGTENRVMIDNLRRTLDPDIHPGIKVMKALSISSEDDIQRYKDYEGAVDYFLFDTKCPTVGGSGEKFDWSILEAYDGNTPFLLSGGIGPDDAQRILSVNHPQFLGIDLNSRFEMEPAVKDVELLGRFLSELCRQ